MHNVTPELPLRGCFSLYIQVTAQHLQGVHHTIDMAALVAMAGVNAGTDQAVANIHTGTQGCFHVGAIEGIDVHRIICTGLLGGSEAA